ncbi:LON peptidase substrate-binding domain-containing protein [Paraburkholderia hayleyella]|uniref:LON peptidase substrate-binding domain-containing protein n=1 Tax=Paraburkholderia hayleyella TaxID=2152889 RepID=UPI0012915AEF|nr:LON peptidase substrate-binding domain-containing protein [Paraburkholderia hayleyella]
MTFSTPSVLANVPLFPLHMVLFPEGQLSLKVFEARYLDMVRRCLREKTPFGVCLLKSGNEIAQADDPAVPEAIGCLAEIKLCDVKTMGVLLIRARGTQRFQLLSHRTETDGLIVGMAQPLDNDAPLEDPVHLAKFGACAEILERIIATLHARELDNLLFAEPFQLNDPSWVSNRLAEILPVTLRAKQKLMELQDAGTRIELVHHYMQQHQML